MATFSATDAGLVGFKLAREKPLAILSFGIVELISTVLSLVILVTLAGPSLMEMQQLTQAGEPDPQAILALYAKIGPVFLLMVPVSVIFGGILYAGASRMVLRPEDRGFGWLKLGSDEFRQALLLLLIWVILMGVYLVVGIAAAVLIGIAFAITPVLGFLVGVLAILAALGVLVFIAVRLSLASPITFATGRMGIGESWRMTKGHFGSLLGAFVLAVVMAMIVGGLAMAIFFGVGSLIFGFANTSATVMQPDMTSMATMFTPVAIAYYLFNAAVSALTAMIVLGPAPTIYKELAAPTDVFD